MSKLVVIDPGHGGKDPGAVSGGLKEKELTLKISKRVKSTLEKNYSANVKMTRSTDKYLTLKERTDFANKQKAEFLISIHINAGGGTGYEDFIYNKLSDSSATASFRNVVHVEVEKVLSEYKIRNRGKKKKNLHVLRESNMSAMLVEILFIDTEKDQKFLKNDEFLNKIADSIALGISKALKLKKLDKSKPTKTDTQPKKSSKSRSSVIVKRGDSGSTVKDLQRVLRKYGYRLGKSGVDGIFGSNTERAVKDFQRDEGIGVDGIVGPVTEKALVRRKKFPGRLLRSQRPYIRGNDVRAVQRKVGTSVDGIYGERTRRAVRSYQRRNDLLVDGIVGPASWKKMFE